jgi:hypothetical protein
MTATVKEINHISISLAVICYRIVLDEKGVDHDGFWPEPSALFALRVGELGLKL